MDKINNIYNELIDKGYFTQEELNLVTCINGYNMDTINECIYARFGVRDYESLINE